MKYVDGKSGRYTVETGAVLEAEGRREMGNGRWEMGDRKERSSDSHGDRDQNDLIPPHQIQSQPLLGALRRRAPYYYEQVT
jgi:hypothetical protein